MLIRLCAVALSASLLLASSLNAQASFADAESLTSIYAEAAVQVSAEPLAPAEVAMRSPLEEQENDQASQHAEAQIGEEQDPVIAALDPRNFLGTYESDVPALIAADLAAAAETTGSIQPLPVLGSETPIQDVAEMMETVDPSDAGTVGAEATLLP